MQTTFNTVPAAGFPGMRYDNQHCEVRSFVAKEAIDAGKLCELVLSGGVWQAQNLKDTGTTSTFLPVLAGISLYTPIREQNYLGSGGTPGGGGYKAGEMVPFVRRGRIWVQWDGGGTWAEEAAVNVWHSSDGSAAQGVFTKTATQTTLHSEIDVAPSCSCIVPSIAQTSAYTDGFGYTIQAAVVAINLGP